MTQESAILAEQVAFQVQHLSPKKGDVLVFTFPAFVTPEVLQGTADALRNVAARGVSILFKYENIKLEIQPK